VYEGGIAVSRTNIEIDDVLIEQVMRRYGLSSKREAVDYALRKAIDGILPMSKEEFLAMEGTGWPGDLAEIKGKPRIDPPKSSDPR
jgi:Arc/MetJ family transcription regulator